MTSKRKPCFDCAINNRPSGIILLSPLARVSPVGVRLVRLIVLAAFLAIGWVPLYGQLQFTKLIDNNTVRPDSAAGQPTFGPYQPVDYYNPLGYTTPVTDGKNVVFNVGLYAQATGSGSFTGCSGTNENSLWSIPIGGGKLTQLAGFYLNLEPAQPSSASTTTCLAPLLAGSEVFFKGSYQPNAGSSTTRSGYFKVPASGGLSSAAVLVGNTLTDGTVVGSFYGGGGVSTGTAILSAADSHGSFIDIFSGATSSAVADPNPACSPYNNFTFNQDITSSDGLVYANWSELAGKTGTSFVVIAGATPNIYSCANVIYDSGNAFGTFTSAMSLLPGITGPAAGGLAIEKVKTAGGRVFVSARQYLADGSFYSGIFEAKGGSLTKIVSSGDAFPGIPSQTLQCRGYTPQYASLSPDFAVTPTKLVTEAYGPATYTCGVSATYVDGLVSVDLKTQAIETIAKTGDSLQPGATLATLAWGVSGISVDGSLAADGHFVFMVIESETNGPTYAVYSTNLNELPTKTTITALPSGQGYFNNVTLTANVATQTSGGGTPTGNVQFLDGATVLSTQALDSTGTATLTMDSLAVGSHSITAMYVGADPYQQSTSTATSVTIAPGTTSLALTTSNATVSAGTAVIFAAKLSVTSAGGVPTGNINFLDGTAALGSTQLDNTGNASLQVGSLTVGSHTISASYAGDQNFGGSTAASLIETVTIPVITPTLTATLQPGATVIYGNPTSASIVVAPPQGSSTSPTGKIAAILDGGVPVQVSLSAGSASVSFGVLNAGAHAIGFSYGGDGTYAPLPIQTKTISVTPAPLTVTAGSATRSYGSANPVLTATVTGLVNGDNITATAATSATPTSPVATYPVTSVLVDPNLRQGNYAIAQNAGSLTVTPLGLTATVTPPTLTYGQAVPTLTGTLNGVLTQDQTNVTAAFTSTATASSGTGTYPVTGRLSGTAAGNYSLALSGSPVVTISAAPLTVKVNSATRIYGLSNPALSGSVTGAVNGDSLTASYSTLAVSGSPVAAYPITATISGSNAADYAVQLTNGTLTVTQAGSSTGLTLSGPSTASGQNVVMTAQVTSATSGTPTGAVTFLDGTTTLGTGTINSQGSAALTAGTLALGTHLLGVSYAGDQNFTASQSASSVETIGTSDYTISATPASVTIKAGQSAQFTFLLTSLFGYNQPVTLSCANLPAGAACNFSPSAVTPTATGASASLTITTTATSAELAPLKLWEGATGSVLACCVLCGIRRKRLAIRLAIFVVLLGGLDLSGCGGGTTASSTSGPAATPTPAGTDAITVSASAGSGGSSHAAQITVVVTP